MEPRSFKSERDTQVVIDKKINIKKGDDVKIKYIEEEGKEVEFANLYLNDEFIGKFDLEELEQFLTLFLAEPL